jgi:hypothetical protein
MNIRQAKLIPLETILDRLGHKPCRTASNQLWYLSPFRDEATPSFKVNPSLNAWYDFGRGAGGDAIDLIRQLEHPLTTAEALSRLRSLTGSLPPPERRRTRKADVEEPPSLELIETTPRLSRNLLNYLRDRGIDTRLAAGLIEEAVYRRGDARYTALAFANRNGGHELRNPKFKGTLGSKDITLLEGDPRHVLVFEGFMDFLSHVTFQRQRPEATVVVLNSVAMRHKAVDAILGLKPESVELYRDNDRAGEELLEYLVQALPGTSVIDRADQYRGFKDLNEWTVAAGRHGTATRAGGGLRSR